MLQKIENTRQEEQAALGRGLSVEKYTKDGVELGKTKKASSLDSRACLGADVVLTATTDRETFLVTSKHFRKEVCLFVDIISSSTVVF